MKLPTFMKIVLNIIFYIVYVLFLTIIVSFALPLLFNFFIDSNTGISSIIQLIIAIFVLFVTTIYRRYFYMSVDFGSLAFWKTDKQDSESNFMQEEELDILIPKEK